MSQCFDFSFSPSPRLTRISRFIHLRGLHMLQPELAQIWTDRIIFLCYRIDYAAICWWQVWRAMTRHIFEVLQRAQRLLFFLFPTNAWCSRSIGGWLLVWRDLCFLWNWTERHMWLCDCAILFSFVSKLQIFKTLDETANPYLALAHVPMAGLCGMINIDDYWIKRAFYEGL